MDSRPPEHNNDELLISKLPAQHAKLVRYIIGQHSVTLAALREAVTKPLELVLTPDQLDAILNDLVEQKQISRSEVNGEVVYGQPIRRRPITPSMRGIWAALESKESTEESEINPQSRRTRSALMDNLLADMSQLETPPAPTPPANQEAAKNLLADLFSAGRSSMQKRNVPPAPKPDETKRKDDLLSDLAAAGRKRRDSDQFNKPEPPPV